MREPVPDRVAQEFLKYFLLGFAKDRSLYLSVRFARERLKSLEHSFPCASWLPVIFQNPATSPSTWQELLAREEEQKYDRTPRDRLEDCTTQPKSRWRVWWTFLLTCLAVTCCVVGLRWTGLLQKFELQAFDRLMRQRPIEEIDDRFLIITISDLDIQYQDLRTMERKGSLSDEALALLLQN